MRDTGLTSSAMYSYYFPLLVPIILFLSSLCIPPRMNADSSAGLFALRDMLEGGAFNSFAMPDPLNIANDVETFLTLWSPGQYLAPGGFIWLGANYGLALSLTALIATLIGVLGWIQVARSFGVSSFVLFTFALGLSTFSYVTLSFRIYNGGEVLLFAAAPWSFYAMRWAANRPPMLCFTISLLSVALLFLAKLTGLIVFAANVGAISLLSTTAQRRVSPATIAMWVASAVGALCFIMFWLTRGPVAARGGVFHFSWFPIWFSVTSVVFSGSSALDFLSWFLGHTWVRLTSYSNEWSDLYTRMLRLSYVLGPLGLLLFAWVWARLRHTRYRDMAALLLTVILLYALPLVVMFLRGAAISPEDRHYRYAGIIFFLLLLTAIDQNRAALVKRFASTLVVVLGLYGLKNFGADAYAQMRRSDYYDPTSGIYQEIVPPAALEYMRSEISRGHVRHPIAVIPSLSAAVSLPGFRILYIIPYRDAKTWAGRADKVFVVVPEELVENGEAEVILRSFIGYEFSGWSEKSVGGMMIYTQ